MAVQINGLATAYAVSSNKAGTIVLRDSSGNFTAGTITASLTGNADTATTLKTARNINGVAFDGSAPITIRTFSGSAANANLMLTSLSTTPTTLSAGDLWNEGGSLKFRKDSNTTKTISFTDDTGLTGGTVTSVGLSLPSIFSVANSPVTASGSFTVTLTNQNKNLFLASDSTTDGVAPSLRKIVKADLPNTTVYTDADFSMTAGKKITAGTSGGASSAGINIPSGAAPNTKTSGDIWNESNNLKFYDGSITNTLAYVPGAQNASYVYIGPSSGSAQSPTWRALVAADIPTLNASSIPSLDASKIGTGTFASGLLTNILSTSGALTTAATVPSGTTQTVNGISVYAARADHAHPVPWIVSAVGTSLPNVTDPTLQENYIVMQYQ